MQEEDKEGEEHEVNCKDQEEDVVREAAEEGQIEGEEEEDWWRKTMLR